MNIYRSMTTVLAGFLLFAYAAPGQNAGALNGKVTAASGAPVPSASVMITDSTGFARNSVTAEDGSFSIQNLPAGTYKIDVEVPGFKRLTQENVQVMAGTPVNLKLGLEAGSEQESVSAQGQAPLANSDSDRIGQGFTGRVINELPIQDLNHQQLVEMMPGISPPAANPDIVKNPQVNRVWNTNGQPALANNFAVDGVENQEAVGNTELHVPTKAGIQQMNLTTANYEADQGRAAGSILSPLSKAGTNGIHGELFEFHTDDWLRARNYFDPSPLPQPVSTYNQFGALISAPVVRNKTFLMFSEEDDLYKDASPVYATVPSARLGGGNFSSLPGVTIYNPFTGTASGSGRAAFANNTIPASLVNPAASAVLSALPAPNLSGVEANYFTNQQYLNDGYRADARLDQRFNDNNLLFLRYGLSYYSTSRASVFGPIDQSGSYSRLRAHEALIGYTHEFDATTFTDIRGAFNRYSNPIYASSSPGSAAAYGLTTLNGQLPSVAIDGMTPLGTNPTYPQIEKDDDWNIVNNWTMRIHNNEVRFGADYYQTRTDGWQNPLFGPAGGYTFSAGATSLPGAALGAGGYFANSLAAFLLGAPTVSGITTSNYVPSYVSRQYAAYVSDRINLFGRITLDLGLRYDYFWPVEPRNNAANYSTYNPGSNTLRPLGSNRAGGVQSNNLNFAPRIGIAFRFNDRTVVRGGYSISYWDPFVALESSTLIPAFTGSAAGTAGGYGVADRFGAFPAISGPGGAAPNEPLYFSQSRVRTPYAQMYNIDIQRDLTHGMLFDVAYVGNVGRDLPFTQDLNAAQPGTGTAGQAFASGGDTAPVYLRGTGFDSNYNSLQAILTKRFSRGLAFNGNYTYSKALDYGAGLSPFLDNNNPFANYGPANFDRRHVFTFTHNWQLPFGAGTSHLNSGALGHILGPWELDGILTYSSGLPFTPTASAALCQCPGNTATANLVQGPNFLAFAPAYYGYFFYNVPYEFSTFSFGQPNAGTAGNVGRNSVRGPDFSNYDLALARSFVFGERARLTFRAEAYNLTNSAHFGQPITNVNSPNFGLSTETIPGYGARTIQGALKVTF